MFICGDLNSRVSNNIDFITEIDQSKPRVSIDPQNNSQGTTFIEFLKDSKFCIINVIVTPELDSYTSISICGKGDINYILTPYNCIQYVKECKVETVSELLSKNNLQMHVSSAFKPPDHSVVTTLLKLQILLPMSYADTVNREVHKRKLYNFNEGSNLFTKGELFKRALINVIDALKRNRFNQESIDITYHKFSMLIIKAIAEHLPTNIF